MLKREIWPPPAAKKNPKPIVTKVVMGDYVGDLYFCAKKFVLIGLSISAPHMCEVAHVTTFHLGGGSFNSLPPRHLHRSMRQTTPFARGDVSVFLTELVWSISWCDKLIAIESHLARYNGADTVKDKHRRISGAAYSLGIAYCVEDGLTKHRIIIIIIVIFWPSVNIIQRKLKN